MDRASADLAAAAAQQRKKSLSAVVQMLIEKDPKGVADNDPEDPNPNISQSELLYDEMDEVFVEDIKSYVVQQDAVQNNTQISCPSIQSSHSLLAKYFKPANTQSRPQGNRGSNCLPLPQQRAADNTNHSVINQANLNSLLSCYSLNLPLQPSNVADPNGIFPAFVANLDSAFQQIVAQNLLANAAKALQANANKTSDFPVTIAERISEISDAHLADNGVNSCTAKRNWTPNYLAMKFGASMGPNRMSYPREFKLMVVKYYHANGRNKYRTCKQFHITKSMLNGWLQKIDKIEQSRPGSLKSGRSGRKPQFPEIERQLNDLYQVSLQRGERVGNRWIRDTARLLALRHYTESELNALCQFSERWLSNFKRRYGINLSRDWSSGSSEHSDSVTPISMSPPANEQSSATEVLPDQTVSAATSTSDDIGCDDDGKLQSDSTVGHPQPEQQPQKLLSTVISQQNADENMHNKSVNICHHIQSAADHKESDKNLETKASFTGGDNQQMQYLSLPPSASDFENDRNQINVISSAFSGDIQANSATNAPFSLNLLNQIPQLAASNNIAQQLYLSQYFNALRSLMPAPLFDLNSHGKKADLKVSNGHFYKPVSPSELHPHQPGKRGRKVQFPQVEKALYEKFKIRKATGDRISNRWLQDEAKRLAASMCPAMFAESIKTSRCMFSEHWLHNFKKRYGISLKSPPTQLRSSSPDIEDSKCQSMNWNSASSESPQSSTSASPIDQSTATERSNTVNLAEWYWNAINSNERDAAAASQIKNIGVEIMA